MLGRNAPENAATRSVLRRKLWDIIAKPCIGLMPNTRRSRCPLWKNTNGMQPEIMSSRCGFNRGKLFAEDDYEYKPNSRNELREQFSQETGRRGGGGGEGGRQN